MENFRQRFPSPTGRDLHQAPRGRLQRSCINGKNQQNNMSRDNCSTRKANQEQPIASRCGGNNEDNHKSFIQHNLIYFQFNKVLSFPPIITMATIINLIKTNFRSFFISDKRQLWQVAVTGRAKIALQVSGSAEMVVVVMVDCVSVQVCKCVCEECGRCKHNTRDRKMNNDANCTVIVCDADTVTGRQTLERSRNEIFAGVSTLFR